ncbi:MAG: hypothetical protein R3D84_06220 [Paracoccaceae bacterium]
MLHTLSTNSLAEHGRRRANHQMLHCCCIAARKRQKPPIEAAFIILISLRYFGSGGRKQRGFWLSKKSTENSMMGLICGSSGKKMCVVTATLCVSQRLILEGPPVLSTQSDDDVHFKLTSNRLHFLELLDLTKGCAFKSLDLTCDFFIFPESGCAAPSIRGKVSDHADALFITDF